MTAMAAVVPEVRRVATYERVSSEDQRERETIKTQTDEIARLLAGQPGVELVGRYVDDGVSGTTPLAQRPDGRRLLADAEAGLFDEVWVYKFDRLGRDTPDQTAIGRWFKRHGIRLISRLEGEPDLLTWDILAAISDNDRRMFLRRTADGMSRAAREGRYTGGIVPFGYRVEGLKQNARLVPDEAIVWADKSAADIVRDIYERLALRGQSCRMIARDFNALGIPTHYARDGRGVRGKQTQGLWRAGRIRNLVVNPVYKGVLQYGRRIDQRGAKTERVGHEITSAPIEGLVSPTLWQAAQDALAANRRIGITRACVARGLCLEQRQCPLGTVGSPHSQHSPIVLAQGQGTRLAFHTQRFSHRRTRLSRLLTDRHARHGFG